MEEQLTNCSIFFIYYVKKFISVFCYENEVLDTYTVFAFDVDSRFDREDHTRFSYVLVDRAYITVFMVFLADEMSKTNLPVFSVSCFADELLAQALRYRTYWKNGGGITVSGGEPLLQIDFLLDLFKKAKAKGIHTTIDTAGGPFTREEPFFSKFQELMQYTDLLLVDIKHIDEKSHKELTGKTNKNILDMIRFLSDIKKPVWIRHVLVPERSDYDEYLNRLNDFIQTLDNVERVEILPYHTLGAYKWKELGLDYPLEGINPPSRERVENAKKILHCS